MALIRGHRTSPAILSLLLFAVTLGLYIPILNSAFLNYDDPSYVTRNTKVLQGLSLNNIAWAFTATVGANWHPLTWISHMCDVQLFGTNPRGHHLDSVLLHAANVVLLFFLLRKATGYPLRSLVVAALFAIHPLNVESVAWVAERKSVLSMFFLLLALAAYGWYASKRTLGRYSLLILCFAAGLMAKPMIVTLPILLLLWDYWPLKRMADAENSAEPRRVSWLVSEKLPLLALAAASSWITLYVQRAGGALGQADLLPLSWRIENAIYSYLLYIVKGIWPSRLAVFYPHPEASLAIWKILTAGAVIVAITLLTWRHRKPQRYLFAGWLWYLAAMIPMIGIAQVGRQAMADRYAYLPLVGLFIMAVWGCAELLERLKISALAASAIGVAFLVTYASLTLLQITYWHDSYTLFSHALAVTGRNGIAEDNLGATLMEMGRPDLAMPHFEAAVEIVPQLSTPHYNLGVLEQQQGHLAIARKEYELALNYSADETEIIQAHNNLGFVFTTLNDLKAAEKEFTAALLLNPKKQNSLLGRGIVEYRQGELDEAAGDLSRAAAIAPFPPADFWLGRVMEDRGETQAAESAYEAALELAPGMAEAQERLKELRARQ